MCSILIDITIFQSIFVELSLTNSVATFILLQCDLSAKSPDVIINRCIYMCVYIFVIMNIWMNVRKYE